MNQDDLERLLSTRELDDATIERLRAVDPEALRKALSPFLRDDELEALLARVRELLRARP